MVWVDCFWNFNSSVFVICWFVGVCKVFLRKFLFGITSVLFRAKLHLLCIWY
jgi:hypothetical protein